MTIDSQLALRTRHEIPIDRAVIDNRPVHGRVEPGKFLSVQTRRVLEDLGAQRAVSIR